MTQNDKEYNFIFYKSFLDFIEIYKGDDETVSKLFFALAEYGVYGIEPSEEDLKNNKVLKGFMITLRPLIKSQRKRREKSSRGGKNHTGNQYTKGDNRRNPNQQVQKNIVEPNGTTLEPNGTDIDIDIDIDKEIEIDKEKKENKKEKNSEFNYGLMKKIKNAIE